MKHLMNIQSFLQPKKLMLIDSEYSALDGRKSTGPSALPCGTSDDIYFIYLFIVTLEAY